MDAIIELLVQRNDLSMTEIQLLQLSIHLLLLLPLVLTIVGIFRYVIGLKTISVYAPVILTFAFFEFGLIKNQQGFAIDVIQGLKFGIVLFGVVCLSTILLYNILRYIRMHYVPKTTLVLTGTSIILVVTIIAATYIFNRKGLIYLDVISVIMITILGENIISILSRKSLIMTVRVILETLLIALLSYLAIVSEPIQSLVTYQPWLLIGGLIVLNIFIGKFWGLRLTEYWRFRELIFTNSQETNGQSQHNTKK